MSNTRVVICGSNIPSSTTVVHLASRLRIVARVFDCGGILKTIRLGRVLDSMTTYLIVSVDACQLTTITRNHALDVNVTLALFGALARQKLGVRLCSYEASKRSRCRMNGRACRSPQRRS